MPQDLVKNPLQLTLLCSTWQGSARGLPETKAGLDQQFVEEVYKWKEKYFLQPKHKRNMEAAIPCKDAIHRIS